MVAHLTPKKFGAQVHLVERVDSLVIVRLDLGLLDILEPLVGSHDCELRRVLLLEFQAQLEIQEVESESGGGVRCKRVRTFALRQ